MAKWRIELRDAHGESQGGTLAVEADNLVKAKQLVVSVCRRRLSDRGGVYLEAKGHYTYRVVAGQDEVGEVSITRLSSGPSDAPPAVQARPHEPRRRRGAAGGCPSGPRRGAEPVFYLYVDDDRREMIQ